MHIKLATLTDLAFAQDFIAARLRQHVSIRWRVGPVREMIPPVRLVLSSSPSPAFVRSFHQEIQIMQIITDSQQFPVTVRFVDKRGNAAVVENIQFSVSDPQLLAVKQDAVDPSSAVVRAVGPLGTGQVSVQADALIGAETALVVGTLDVQVVGGQAVSAVISTSTPEEQP